MKLTYFLMALCIIIFVLIGTAPRYDQNEIFERYGFSKENFFGGEFWCLITSLFLHGSVAHLVLNMVALFFFGRALENEIAPWKFLTIFLLGGIGGNLISMFFYPGDQLFIGASGAIFAIMGAVMIIKPFEFIFYPYLIPVPLALVGIIYTVYTILAFLFGGDPNVAYSAHLGGLAVGIIAGLREGGVKGLLIVSILFVVLFMTPVIWNILSALDYSRILGSLF